MFDEPTMGQHRRNALLMLSGQGVRVGLQGAYFVLLARSLGASDFGAAAALLAVTALLAPFSNLGAGMLLLRNVSLDPNRAPVQWANTVALTILSGGILTCLTAAIGTWVSADRLLIWIAILVGLSELVGARLVESAALLHQGFGQMGRSGSLQAILQAARLALLLLVIVIPVEVTLATWAVSVALATSLVSAGIAILVLRRIGGTAPSPREYVSEWKQGALFAIGMSSQTVYNDIDKILLARLGTLAETGNYSAAYRIIDMAYVPIRSIIAVNYPSMMRAGENNNVRHVLQVIKQRVALPAMGYGIIGALLLSLGAEILPILLGPSFNDTVDALRWLALLLPLKAMHYMAADALTTSGHQGMRTVVQIAIALANVGLCVALIPEFGYEGAIAASLLSDAFLACCLWGIVTWHLVRS